MSRRAGTWLSVTDEKSPSVQQPVPGRKGNGELSITCRNRHCPKCQSTARDKWLTERAKELLPVPYCHVVFTIPEALAPLALQNAQLVYALLFRAVSQTLLEIAADPRRLGAQIGFLAVLHSWSQNLLHHPHIHCVVPAGGLAPDGSRWIYCRRKFFLPIKVLSRLFRGKLLAFLRDAFAEGKLQFHGQVEPFTRARSLSRLARSVENY